MKLFPVIYPAKGIPAEFVGGPVDRKRITVCDRCVQFESAAPPFGIHGGLTGEIKFRKYNYEIRTIDNYFVANDEGFFLYDHKPD